MQQASISFSCPTAAVLTRSQMEELMKTMCKVVISSTPVRSPAKLSKDVHEKEDYTLRYVHG